MLTRRSLLSLLGLAPLTADGREFVVASPVVKVAPWLAMPLKPWNPHFPSDFEEREARIAGIKTLKDGSRLVLFRGEWIRVPSKPTNAS